MSCRLASLMVSAAASIVVGICASGAVPALAANRVVATAGSDTVLDAFAGRVVFSDWDHAQFVYRLVELVGNEVRPLPVAPRPEPFDVDLGPDRRGRTVAVYSRCKRPLVQGYVDGRRGCDIYSFSFASGRETRVGGASPSVDEYSPAVWRDRLSFSRTYRSRVGMRARHVVYWRYLTGDGRLRRIRSGGKRGHIPADLDMRGDRVAVIWNQGFGAAEVRVNSIGGRSRLISTIPGSGAAAISYQTFGTSIVGGRVYWMVTQSFEPPYLAELRRRTIAPGREERALIALSEVSSSFAQDGRSGYVAQAGPPETGRPRPYTIHRVDGLQYQRAPRLELR